jgi:hypothetical protein
MANTIRNPHSDNATLSTLSCEFLNNYGSLLQIFKYSNFYSYISVPFTPFR